MKIFKSKITEIVSIVFIAIVVISISICIANINKNKPITVKTKGTLERIYNKYNGKSHDIATALCFPVNILYKPSKVYTSSDGGYTNLSESIQYQETSTTDKNLVDSTNNDYSTTNVQVENVDEADIIKTDGNYIYSLSNTDIVITDISDENNPIVASRINSSSLIPVDLLLYDKYLVIISKQDNSKYTTDVRIYDVSNKKEPILKKSFRNYQGYYTSRMLGGELYIISNGYLNKEEKNVVAYYDEDNKRIDMDYNKMYYFKEKSCSKETIISHINLAELENKSFDVNTYLIDLNYIYMSENSIYLANLKYKGNDNPTQREISEIFGITGVWNYFLQISDFKYRYCTEIIKLDIKNDGNLEYVNKTQIDGKPINQFSFDEYNSNLRIAVQDGIKGSKIVVLDSKLKKIGESKYVGEKEVMYSSRFVGEKAYLVTYKNTDPLFVFNLSNPKSPEVLGKLEIPGYSTYLHPYDENHIIGIGVQTEDRVVRDTNGNVVSTSTYITGMKMALFDVQNVESPKQISEVIIGDKKTKSAILTNHKALLFSKEKQMIAIPINSYSEDIDSKEKKSDNIDDIVTLYNKLGNNYISEGYLVYNINLEEGIKLKGVITHDIQSEKAYRGSQLLRGIYIKDSLFTVSQHELKVNNLYTLQQISNIEI